MDVHFARTLPQRKALCNAFHGFDDYVIYFGRVFWLQNRLSQGVRFFHWIQRTVPTHDYGRRIHSAFPEHRSWNGTDLRDADPGFLSGVHGDHDALFHDQEFPLRDSGHFCAGGYRYAHSGHRKYVRFCGAHAGFVCTEHWRGVDGTSETAPGTEREAGAGIVRMMRSPSLRWVLLAGMLAVLACDHDKDSAHGQTPPTPAPASAATPGPA